MAEIHKIFLPKKMHHHDWFRPSKIQQWNSLFCRHSHNSSSPRPSYTELIQCHFRKTKQGNRLSTVRNTFPYRKKQRAWHGSRPTAQLVLVLHSKNVLYVTFSKLVFRADVLHVIPRYCRPFYVMWWLNSSQNLSKKIEAGFLNSIKNVVENHHLPMHQIG